MKSDWQPINTQKTADQASLSACWDDYPLVDWIFCRSSIPLRDDSEVEGRALRILAKAWCQSASHVEIALFDFETSVPVPPTGDFLKIELGERNRLEVRFSRDAVASVCAFAFFRFLDLSDWGAARFYRHPSVLMPIESEIKTGGFIEYSGDKGERVIIAGEEADPTLWLSDSHGQTSMFDLDPTLCDWLLVALHCIGKSKKPSKS
jgi:hypothetical protein